MRAIYQQLIFFLVVALQGVTTFPEDKLPIDICHFVTRHNYPCEVYTVHTTDGYILSMVRIPYSPHDARNATSKPVVYLAHGLACSSDCFLVQTPTDSIAFILSDAGYDVWLGNARGNVHSRRHLIYSPSESKFWEFDWHEVGIYDLPASIDFILMVTKQTGVHYVGHSHGTTILLVLLSSLPEYSVKIKTSHLLGAVAFCGSTQITFGRFLGNAYEILGPLINELPFIEVARRSFFMSHIVPRLCYHGTEIVDVCKVIMTLLGTWSPNMNESWLSDFLTVYPSGCSERQILHYLQEFNSNRFQQYDYGKLTNLKMYSTESPPDYHVEWINTSVPIDIYYSDFDTFSTVVDIFKLARKMVKGQVQLHRVYAHSYSHVDFILATNVKEVIFNCILSKINMFENKLDTGKRDCNHLLTTIL